MADTTTGLAQLEAEHRQLEEEKRQRIGGSDISAIVGLNPYKSAFDVWVRLTGQEHLLKTAADDDDEEEKDSDGEQDDHADRLELGRLLEEPIAQRYTLKTGIALRPLGELVHPVYDWAGGHIDREAVDGSRDVECKSVDPWDRERQWSMPGEVQRVPEYVTIQVCWYLTMRGYSRPHHIAAQRGFRPLQVYPFNPTDQIQRIGANLMEQAHQFITKYVKTGNPPPLGDGPAAKAFLAKHHMLDPKKQLAPAPPGAEDLARRYEQAKTLADKWAKEKKAIRNDIAALVGDRYGLAGETFTATWPEVPEKTEAVTDHEALCRELCEDNEIEIPAELIQKHTRIVTVRKGYRTFKVNTKKG